MEGLSFCDPALARSQTHSPSSLSDRQRLRGSLSQAFLRADPTPQHCLGEVRRSPLTFWVCARSSLQSNWSLPLLPSCPAQGSEPQVPSSLPSCPLLQRVVLPSPSLQGAQPQTTTNMQWDRVGLNSSPLAYKLCDPGGGG